MKAHLWIVEFVRATHCILTQWQVKPELPESRRLVRRNIVFTIGTPIYAKLTMGRLSFGRYVSKLTFDRNLLWFGWVHGRNCVVLFVFRATFWRSWRSKLPSSAWIGIIGGQPPHQHSISAWIWYERTQWWHVSRGCCREWPFGENRNGSWRSTPDSAGDHSKVQGWFFSSHAFKLMSWNMPLPPSIVYLLPFWRVCWTAARNGHTFIVCTHFWWPPQPICRRSTLLRGEDDNSARRRNQECSICFSFIIYVCTEMIFHRWCILVHLVKPSDHSHPG